MNPVLPGILNSPGVYLVILAWSLLWKGLALWRAAQDKQRNWFMALLIVNSVGILEIIFLFNFSKNKLTIKEMKSWTTLLSKPKTH